MNQATVPWTKLPGMLKSPPPHKTPPDMCSKIFYRDMAKFSPARVVVVKHLAATITNLNFNEKKNEIILNWGIFFKQTSQGSDNFSQYFIRDTNVYALLPRTNSCQLKLRVITQLQTYFKAGKPAVNYIFTRTQP